jgi:hypothetical protein
MLCGMDASIPRQHRLAPSASIAQAVEALFVTERDGETTHVSIPRPELQLLVRFGPAARGGVDAHAFGGRARVHRKRLKGGQRTVSARLRLGARRMRRALASMTRGYAPARRARKPARDVVRFFQFPTRARR